jgi:hypothetical protein
MKNIKMIIITLMIAGLLISAGIQSKAVVISVYEGVKLFLTI